MHTLSKKEVGQWVLLDCIAQKHVLEEKLNFLEKKHSTDFQTFEQSVNQATTEDFAAWDDYIEWMAHRKLLSELLSKIEDIRNGRFQMA